MGNRPSRDFESFRSGPFWALAFWAPLVPGPGLLLFDYERDRERSRYPLLSIRSTAFYKLGGGSISIRPALYRASGFPFFTSSLMNSSLMSCNALQILSSDSMSYTSWAFLAFSLAAWTSTICSCSYCRYSAFARSLRSNSSSVISSKLLVGRMWELSALVGE